MAPDSILSISWHPFVSARGCSSPAAWLVREVTSEEFELFRRSALLRCTFLLGCVFPRFLAWRERLKRLRPVRTPHVGFRIAEIAALYVVNRTGPVLGGFSEVQRQLFPSVFIDLIQITVEGLNLYGARRFVVPSHLKDLALIQSQVPLADPRAAHTRVHLSTSWLNRRTEASVQQFGSPRNTKMCACRRARSLWAMSA